MHSKAREYIYITNSMKVAIVVVTVIFGWACNSAAAQENVCSAFCSSLGMLQSTPGKSCSDIYQINKASRGASGNYWINTTTGVHQVYCDMELECGGHKGGWMRIADLDTSRGDDCPSGWNNITTPNQPPYPAIPVCRSPSDTLAGCFPTFFSVSNASYNVVCGMIKGYQKGSPAAFDETATYSLNNYYVEGISITLGHPRKHVWTYAVGLTDEESHTFHTCPCTFNPGPAPPSFVGDHYYCESGNTGAGTVDIHYTNDPLWDSSGCSVNNNCCANPNQPWFFREMVVKVQDDIEVRLCTNELFDNEAVLVEQIQLYVH